jgi:hypothetical protein
MMAARAPITNGSMTLVWTSNSVRTSAASNHVARKVHLEGFDVGTAPMFDVSQRPRPTHRQLP